MQMKFIGRNKPLEDLNLLLQKKTASLVVINGRRRVGKSRLVEEFGKDKQVFRFSGLAPTDETEEHQQREEFARQFSDNGMPKPAADDWANMFNYLGDKTKKGKYIIFFDEISWMGSRDETFLGKLKNAWDLYFSKNPNLILILCGSVSTWIEKNILKSTGFFGRISLAITLDELSLKNSIKLLNTLGFKGSHYEKLLLLNVTGGVPWYIENINPSLSAIQNIQRLCFEKNGLFTQEFNNIFYDLLGKRKSVCKDIVSFLSKQKLTHSQIATKLNYSRSGALTEYLNDLITLGFVRQEKQWDIHKCTYQKISYYSLKDNYLRFYFRFIEPNLSKIRDGRYSDINIKALPSWFTVMGFQFENLVLNNKKYIWDSLGLSGEMIVMDGPYVKKKGESSSGCQIDYMIQTDTNTLYVCEIKYSRNSISQNIIKEVQKKIEALNLQKKYTCVPVLIHATDIDNSVMESEYFYRIIDIGDLIKEA